MTDDKQAKEGKLILNCSFCGKSQYEVRKLIASRRKSKHEAKNLIEGPYVFICNGCVESCKDILREEPQQEFETSNEQSVEAKRNDGLEEPRDQEKVDTGIQKSAEAKRNDGLDGNDLSTIISSIRDVLAHIRSVQFLTVTLSASAFLLSLFAVPGAPDLVRELEEFSRILDAREYVTVLRKIFAPHIEQTLSRRSSDRLVKQMGSQALRLWTDPTHVARFAHLTVKEIVDTLNTINVGAEMIDRISVEPSEESRLNKWLAEKEDDERTKESMNHLVYGLYFKIQGWPNAVQPGRLNIICETLLIQIKSSSKSDSYDSYGSYDPDHWGPEVETKLSSVSSCLRLLACNH